MLSAWLLEHGDKVSQKDIEGYAIALGEVQIERNGMTQQEAVLKALCKDSEKCIVHVDA